MISSLISIETVWILMGIPDSQEYLYHQLVSVLISLVIFKLYFVVQVDNDFAFGLFDLDWDVFSHNIQGCVNRVPAIEEAGIKSTVCGPGRPHLADFVWIKISIQHVQCRYGDYTRYPGIIHQFSSYEPRPSGLVW